MNMSIAITNLGKYNEGELDYKWLSLPATEQEIKNTLDHIGININGRYEEYFISDYESPFPIHEYDCINKLNDLAEELEGITIPQMRYGQYDTEEVINFINELESNNLIQGSYEYIGNIIHNDNIDETIQNMLEDGDSWLSIRQYLCNTDSNNDYQMIDGYNNLQRLNNNHLKEIVKRALEEVRKNV